MSSTHNTVLATIRRINVNVKENINDSDDLMIDLGFTSLSYLELIVEIETMFNIEFPDVYLPGDNLITIECLIRVVEDLVHPHGSDESVFNKTEPVLTDISSTDLGRSGGQY